MFSWWNKTGKKTQSRAPQSRNASPIQSGQLSRNMPGEKPHYSATRQDSPAAQGHPIYPRKSTSESHISNPRRTSFGVLPNHSSHDIQEIPEFNKIRSMPSVNDMVDSAMQRQKSVRIANESGKLSNVSTKSQIFSQRILIIKQSSKLPKKRNKIQKFFQKFIKDMFNTHQPSPINITDLEYMTQVSDYNIQENTEPIVPESSVNEFCDDRICTGECLTCGSDKHLEKRFQSLFDRVLLEQDHTSNADDTQNDLNDERTGTITVSRLMDRRGRTPRDLNEALTMLLTEGIVSEVGEMSHSEPVDSGKVTDESVMKSVCPGETIPVKKVASEKIFVEAACNTSLNAFQHRTVFERTADMLEVNNSLVQLKFRSQLHDDSCTQFFALKSELQLEPYLMDIRAQESKKKAPIIERIESDTLVEHQPGMLRLSQPSKSESMLPLDLIRSEREVYMKNLIEVTEKQRVVSEHEQLEVDENRRSTLEESPSCCYKCHGDHRFSGELESLEHLPTGTLENMVDPYDEIAAFNIPCPTIDSFDIKVSTGEITADTQLIFCIHALQPTRELVQVGMTSRTNIIDIGDVPAYVLKWTFLKYNDSLVFSLEDLHKGAIAIKFSRQYHFDISMGAFIYIWRIPMAVELFIRTNAAERLIGKCVCKLGRCLPNLSRAYSTVGKIQNLDLCLCYSELTPKDFGTLQLKYRIIGNQAQFDSCRPPKPQILRIPPLLVDPVTKSTEKSMSMKQTASNMISDAELQAFQDGLNLVLVRNKALRTTQEEISNELRDRTTWMHEELKWRLTLQENAILSGKDPNTVKWRQWKDETTANVRYRPISDEEYFKNGMVHLEIEIVEMALMMDSRPLGDDNITHMYVEYTFLTFAGIDMETQTMRKPQDERPVRFRFKRPFDIHVDDPEAKMLADMIRANDSIVFTLIAQPIEALKEIRSCWEFGYASLVLFDLLQSRTNTTIQTILIRDTYAKDAVVGTMKVRFTGVLAMRSMALHILTPPSFKIIR